MIPQLLLRGVKLLTLKENISVSPFVFFVFPDATIAELPV